MRRTKIICTLGPSTDSYETMVALVKAGMNVCRLNMAHGDHDEQQKRIDLVKKVREELGVPLPIMVDIKGPEVRTGHVPEPIPVEKGDVFYFTGEQISAHDNIIPINYPDIAHDVFIGGKILLNDGLLAFEINEIKDNLIHCTALTHGKIGNHKNMHFPGVHLLDQKM